MLCSRFVPLRLTIQERARNKIVSDSGSVRLLNPGALALFVIDRDRDREHARATDSDALRRALREAEPLAEAGRPEVAGAPGDRALVTSSCTPSKTGLRPTFRTPLSGEAVAQIRDNSLRSQPWEVIPEKRPLERPRPASAGCRIPSDTCDPTTSRGTGSWTDLCDSLRRKQQLSYSSSASGPRSGGR